MRTFASLLYSVLLMASVNGQKAKLSLKLEEGSTYPLISHSTTVLNQEVFGQKMEIQISIEGSMSFLVNTADKSGYKMTVSYDSLKFSMGLPQGNLELSSENQDKNDYFSQLLAELKQIPFQLTMDRKGHVLEIENVEKKWEMAITKYDQIPQEQLAQIKSRMMNAFGEGARISGIEMSTAIFPEKAVKNGAWWTSIRQKDMGIALTSTNTYTYEGREGELSCISVESRIESSNKESWVESNGMLVRYELSGSMSGLIKVSKKNGWPTEATFEQNLEGITYLKDSEQVPGGMEIPMDINSITKITDERSLGKARTDLLK